MVLKLFATKNFAFEHGRMMENSLSRKNFCGPVWSGKKILVVRCGPAEKILWSGVVRQIKICGPAVVAGPHYLRLCSDPSFLLGFVQA